jgi:hypothetical protein
MAHVLVYSSSSPPISQLVTDYHEHFVVLVKKVVYQLACCQKNSWSKNLSLQEVFFVATILQIVLTAVVSIVTERHDQKNKS